MREILFIDDEPNIQATFTMLERALEKKYKVRYEQPDFSFQALVSKIIKANPAALVMDLQLDENPAADCDNGQHPTYTAQSVAQELRTKMDAGNIKPFPIVLTSVQIKFDKLYEKNLNSHDLFDWTFKKGEFEYKELALQIEGLINGYNSLSKNRAELAPILALQKKEAHFLPPALDMEFRELTRVSSKAFFLLHELLNNNSLLIDESVLAARLGIDRKESTGWQGVLHELSECKYSGCFNEGWNRWWTHKLELWWDAKIDTTISLRKTPAEERVRLIKKALKKRALKHSRPIHDNFSSRFWVVSKKTGKPLDPIDAVRIFKSDLKSWQSHDYLSPEEAINHREYKIQTVDQAIIDRFKKENG